MNYMLKKMTGLFAALFVFLACAPSIFAEEEIELPDVTTVVSGGALTAGKDSVPDYTSALPTAQTATIELPQVADEPAVAPAPEPEPKKATDTRFRLGGGIAALFPLGDDLVQQKIAAVFAGEVPLMPIAADKELGAQAHLLLGGAVGKDDVGGGFDGELSAGVYFRVPMNDVFLLQPSLEYGIVLMRADGSTHFDSQFLLACSARFVPNTILDGALEFAITPVLQLAPFSDNAVCTLGFRLGALYAFRK